MERSDPRTVPIAIVLAVVGVAITIVVAVVLVVWNDRHPADAGVSAASAGGVAQTVPTTRPTNGPAGDPPLRPSPVPTVLGQPTPMTSTPRAAPALVVSRQDALAHPLVSQARIGVLRIDRRAAKLLTWGEWSRSGTPDASGDPAALVWVVASWGDFVVGGPPGVGATHADWATQVIYAETGAVGGTSVGPEIAAWSQLVDRGPP